MITEQLFSFAVYAIYGDVFYVVLATWLRQTASLQRGNCNGNVITMAMVQSLLHNGSVALAGNIGNCDGNVNVVLIVNAVMALAMASLSWIGQRGIGTDV